MASGGRTMKRTSIILAAGLAVLAVLAAGAAAETRYARGVCTFSLWAAPSWKSKRVDGLIPGQAVSILRTKGVWVRVRTRAGLEGWLPASFLTKTRPTPAVDRACQTRVKRLQLQLALLKKTMAARTRAIGRLDDKVRELQLRHRRMLAKPGNTRFLLMTLKDQQVLIDRLRAEILALKNQ